MAHCYCTNGFGSPLLDFGSMVLCMAKIGSRLVTVVLGSSELLLVRVMWIMKCLRELLPTCSTWSCFIQLRFEVRR